MTFNLAPLLILAPTALSSSASSLSSSSACPTVACLGSGPPPPRRCSLPRRSTLGFHRSSTIVSVKLHRNPRAPWRSPSSSLPPSMASSGHGAPLAQPGRLPPPLKEPLKPPFYARRRWRRRYEECGSGRCQNPNANEVSVSVIVVVFFLSGGSPVGRRGRHLRVAIFFLSIDSYVNQILGASI